MKLVLVIVHNDDAETVLRETLKAGFRATKLSSSGGFMHVGNTTLIMGVEDERLDELMKVVEKFSSRRTEMVSPLPNRYCEGCIVAAPIEVSVGGATIFVLEVEDYIQV